MSLDLPSSYLHMHERIRNVTGVGEGKGPILSIFEGFEGVDKWYGWAQGGPDRAMLDVHQYTVFQKQDSRPILNQSTKGCDWWYDSVRNTTNRFGLYNTGEWSLAWNEYVDGWCPRA
jgi:glucan 1,3-beta-glucosidase